MSEPADDPQALYESIPDEDFDEEQWAEYWGKVYSDPQFFAHVPRRPVQPLGIARRTTANGSVMAAIALGMREVFDPDKRKGQIIVQRDESGDGDDPDKPFHLDFDPDDPRATRATVRSWAADHGADDGADDAD